MDNGISIKDYALFMLAYSTRVPNSNIVVAKSGMGVFITAGNKNIQRNQTDEEIQLWLDAINYLEVNGYIVKKPTKDPIYDITLIGKIEARDFIDQTSLDINKNPKETIDRVVNA